MNTSLNTSVSTRHDAGQAGTELHAVSARPHATSGARWTQHPLHGSLVRHTLYLGVERTVLGVEGTLCLAVLFGVGVSLATLALLGLVVVMIHPVMVWVTAKDPQATAIAVRSRAYADFYAPHAALHPSRAARPPRLRPSVPGGR